WQDVSRGRRDADVQASGAEGDRRATAGRVVDVVPGQRARGVRVRPDADLGFVGCGGLGEVPEHLAVVAGAERADALARYGTAQHEVGCAAGRRGLFDAVAAVVDHVSDLPAQHGAPVRWRTYRVNPRTFV